MTYADLVLAEYIAQHPDRRDRAKSLSDEMIALCAVLDRQALKGTVAGIRERSIEHIVRRVPVGYPDGYDPQPSARGRGDLVE